MQTKIRNTILNITALIGFFAGYYPAVILFRFYTKVNSRIIDLLFDAGLMLAGYAASSIIMKNNDSRKQFIAYLSLREVAAYLSILVPAAAAVTFYYHGAAWRIFIEVIIAVILYYIGLNAPFMDFTEILSGQRILYGTIIISITLFADIYFLESDLKNQLFIFGYVFLVISLILKNQFNLERIFTAGNKLEFSVPKYIRSYNLFGVIIIFLAILVIFYLKPVAIMFLQAVWAVIRYIIWLFYMLLSLFKLEGEPGHGGKEGGVDSLPPGESNPIWDFIFYTVLTLLFVYAVINWGPNLIKAIIRGIDRLINFFMKVFKRWDKATDNVEYYIDEDEIIKPEGNKPRIGLFERLGLKRKNIDKVRNITDPVLKVRALFRLVLEKINLSRVNIKPSDTANEILIKSMEFDDIQPDFAVLTGLYESVRYGDEIPDKETLLKAEDLYDKIIINVKKEKNIKNSVLKSENI